MLLSSLTDVTCQDPDGCSDSKRTALIAGKLASSFNYLFNFVLEVLFSERKKEREKKKRVFSCTNIYNF